jgi:hypothetical protein
VLDEGETWAAEDVPPGPFFHGSRFGIPIGEYLRPDEVDPGGGDTRLRAFATTSLDEACRWAWQRNRAAGPTMYVYEVEVAAPEVDTNVHRMPYPQVVTSIMAERMQVVRLVSAELDDGQEQWPWPT